MLDPMTRLFPFIALFVGLAFPSFAQDEEDTGREARGRVAWFIAVAVPENLPVEVPILTGDSVEKVMFPKREVSRPVKIPADGLLRVAVPDPNAQDDKLPYEILAEVRVPEGVQKCLVILVPTVVDGKFRFKSRVQDLRKFGGGDAMYINVSPKNILVTLGEEKIGLKPGMTQIHSAKGIDQAKNVAVRYEVYNEETKKWRKISASTVRIVPTRREICIFSWDEQRKRPDYHGMSFSVQPEEES